MAEVEVREAPSGGRGVFACESVEAGEVVRPFEIEREVTAEAPLRPDRDERPEHCPMIDGRLFLVAVPDRYYNHSCDPNAWLRYGAAGAEVVARRRIAAGEEITFDYLINNAGGDSWPCRCGSSRCRGETGTSFFELPEPFRREYRPLLADWFVERHRERLAAAAP